MTMPRGRNERGESRNPAGAANVLPRPLTTEVAAARPFGLSLPLNSVTRARSRMQCAPARGARPWRPSAVTLVHWSSCAKSQEPARRSGPRALDRRGFCDSASLRAE